MQTVYQQRTTANHFTERRRSMVSAVRPGMHWDYQKLMYFFFVMLGGMIFWAFVIGAVRYGLK